MKMPLHWTSMLHSSPTRCFGKGVFAADDASHGQRLSPSPLMSNDEPCYAARRRRRSRARQRVPACAKSPRSAAGRQRRRGMVAPRGMKPQELVFVRRRSFYENASSFGARFYETLLLPPLPYLVTVFPINSHPFDADTAGRNTPRQSRKVRLAHFLPFPSWRNGLPCP